MTLSTATPVRLRRFVPAVSAVTLALSATYAAVLVVLLPAQVAALDPDAKATNLAIVTTVSFALTVAAQPLIGARSDRTGGRLGRRAPWMLGCAVVAAVLLVTLGAVHTLAALAVVWALAQFALNGVDIAASAAVPDQVPVARRGSVFAVLGFVAVLGAALGVVAAGGATDARGPYASLAVAVVVVAGLYVLLDRDRPVVAPAVPAGRAWWAGVREAAATMSRTPVFARGLAARLLFGLAYQLVYAFQLYVLVDHVGVPEDQAQAVLVRLTVGALVAILVGAVVAGWWSDRVRDRRPFMAGASALLAVALVVPVVVPTVAGMAVFAVLKGLAFGAFAACGTALATEAMPHGGATAGRDLGVYNVATNVPQTVAPALAAALVGSAGGYPALFAVAAVVAVLALWVSARIPAPAPEA